MGAYDRPSWREIDRRKDGSSGKRRNRRDRKEKREHSTRYDKYKADLNRLFDQGLAGELLKKSGKSTDNSVAEKTSKTKKSKGVLRRKGSGRIPKTGKKAASRFKLIRAVIDAGDTTDLVAAIDELVQGFGLPDDWDVLVRVLEYPDEALVSKAMTRMMDILATKVKISRKASLKERLRSISQTASDMDVRKKAEELEDLL